VLTLTTLFPNPVQTSHGVFVETRLRKVLDTGAATARVVAPVPWLPSFVDHPSMGPLHQVPRQLVRHGLMVDHPRYVVVPKIGMNVTPFTLYRTMRRAYRRLVESGHRIDLIDAHYFYPDGVAATWLAKEFDLPVVITARGTDLNLIPQYPIPRRMIQTAAADADGLITVCQALKDSLLKLGVPAERVVCATGETSKSSAHSIAHRCEQILASGDAPLVLLAILRNARVIITRSVHFAIYQMSI
jgi:hypothetical protein